MIVSIVAAILVVAWLIYCAYLHGYASGYSQAVRHFKEDFLE